MEALIWTITASIGIKDRNEARRVARADGEALDA